MLGIEIFHFGGLFAFLWPNVKREMRKELEKILKRNIEGYRGYKLAAEDISNENFKNFLENYAENRKQFVDEIREIFENQGLDSVVDTSFLGDLHRAFIRIKENTSSNKDKAILAECARGESMALSDYNKVLESADLPKGVLQTVMKQRDRIMAAEKTMRELAPIV